MVDGYGCMLGCLVSILLYLGFGFVNGIVNLYNVCCVCIFIVNIIGDYISWYLFYDVLLIFDIELLVCFVLGWVYCIIGIDDIVFVVVDFVC